MTEEEAQNFAINTYNDNIKYLEQNNPQLFEKITLLDTAIDLGELKANYDLHFINGYFDIINLSTNQLFYGKNSTELSKELLNNNINTLAKENSFKAFYDYKYEDSEIALEKGLLWEYTTGDAPIINFVNKNLPQTEDLNSIHKFIIFGIGLGLHIPLIHEKLKSKTYLIVEPNLELFKLSLFVTNYAKLAQEANLILSIAEDELNFRNSFDQFYNESFVFNHYFKFFQLSNNFSFYIKTIQNKLVSQDFYTYPYNRTFLSLYRTHSYIMEEYKLLDISRIHNLDFTKKPILYLAAGPSLQKNIEFVKKNQNKFTIVTIYATLPLLEKHNIKPDIVTQYDEQNHAVLNTLEKIEDIDFFKNTIFIFSSHVNTKLMNSFRKENIYIFQAMFELKKGFGTLTSPSIGELTYALLLILGAKKVYLIGLDLAFDTQTGETHIEGHSGANAFANLKDEEDSSEENYSYRKNTIRVKGNFVDTVKTTPSFKTNIDSFSYFTEQFKQADVEIYNLSNGAYLLDTIPLKIENIQINSLEDKKIDSTVIINDLNKISTVNYSTEDMENKNLKISNAKKMKKALESFFKIKNYTKFGDYQNNLIITLQTLLFNENKDSDLKSVLTNYSQHVIPFIFHLFNVNTEKKNLSFIYELNKVLKIQFNKIVDTYLISVLYSKDESSQLTKKLNKQIKEYKIDKTLYCEPIFKELSETAPLKDSKISGENAIGMFAVNENLENKNLLEYITNIVNTYDCKLKIFYLFEYQKNKAQQIFKNIKNKIELIIPRNLESIASEIEVYIDLNKTSSLESVNYVLLNKYINIFCISFQERLYIKNNIDKNKSKENINLKKKLLEENLPNSSTYNFINDLNNLKKEKIEIIKKGSLGFIVDNNILDDSKFLYFIKVLKENFPKMIFKAYCFNESQEKKALKKLENIQVCIIDNLDFLKDIELFISYRYSSIFSTLNLEKYISRLHPNIFQLVFDNRLISLSLLDMDELTKKTYDPFIDDYKLLGLDSNLNNSTIETVCFKILKLKEVNFILSEKKVINYYIEIIKGCIQSEYIKNIFIEAYKLFIMHHLK